MIDPVGNFPPGPGALPLPVLEHGRDELMVELAGHRSVGGVRASIYNAVPVEALRALRSFMERFRTATP